MIIDGRKIADDILEELKQRIEKLKEKAIFPTLVIILVGDSPQSISYVKQKKLKGEKIGINVIVKNLDSKISNAQLITIIDGLNKDTSVHGIIIQRPLPSQINSGEIDNAVTASKDVDGFNPNSKFELPLGEAIITLLKNTDKDFKSKKIAIIGKGPTGGGPVIRTFRKLNIPIKIVDSKTKNPQKITKESDIIISAVGRENAIKTDMIAKNVILISIGLYKGSDEKLHGDYNEEEIEKIASFYTPTPGGVGPVNVAMLLKNLVRACENFRD